MTSPSFALVVPPPLVWLLARGVVTELLLDVDPSALLGHQVALQVSPHESEKDYRQLRRLLAGTAYARTTVDQVKEQSPKGAVVGVVRMARVVPLPGQWQCHFEEAQPLDPLTVPKRTMDLLALPRVVRAALQVRIGLALPVR
jgi:hypothetical protein